MTKGADHAQLALGHVGDQAGVYMRDAIKDGTDRRQDGSLTKSSWSAKGLGGLATPRTWSTRVVIVEVAQRLHIVSEGLEVLALNHASGKFVDLGTKTKSGELAGTWWDLELALRRRKAKEASSPLDH